MADENEQLLEDYFAALSPSWVPDASDATGRRYVTVPLTRLYGDPMFGKPRGVRFDQGLVAWVQAPLYSPATGAPITISVGSYSEDPVVNVRIVEASGCDPRVFEPDEDAELASDGRSIAFLMPPEVADCPGVYRAQMRVVDSTDVERARDEFWIYVDRGMWKTDGSVGSETGPPTFAEVRTSLRDHPAANRLLGDYEFDPAEIGMAVISAVQAFNNALPPLPPNYAMTTIKLPGQWRQQFRDGAVAHLMSTAAMYFRRNSLPYTAGGMSVNDLARDKDYDRVVDRLMADFRRWVQLTRTSISLSAGWGNIGSGYPFSMR